MLLMVQEALAVDQVTDGLRSGSVTLLYPRNRTDCDMVIFCSCFNSSKTLLEFTIFRIRVPSKKPINYYASASTIYFGYAVLFVLVLSLVEGLPQLRIQYSNCVCKFSTVAKSKS